MFDQALYDRLIARTVLDMHGCRIWQGQTDGKKDKTNVYGRTTRKGVTIATHIAMWWAVKGRPRKGMQIDHRCANTLCIEITHLQERTNLKNSRLREKRKKHKGDVLKCLAVRG
ncbi:HNH endonuclease protein [Rhizobium phage RHph_TM3_14A]|nr:HNH endonuclease protein [Rhizobium phage RHph_TM27A]QIG66981.1 HNH endonuclease protein [Rhizobium phage RHph_TM27B]QIG67070.1 HNH endonuclease protein [Rhizobium phage RHph_TM29]QIG67526.1 HNH endonuclease protein [Rhizobium phage RHph_TM3_14A]